MLQRSLHDYSDSQVWLSTAIIQVLDVDGKVVLCCAWSRISVQIDNGSLGKKIRTSITRNKRSGCRSQSSDESRSRYCRSFVKLETLFVPKTHGLFCFEADNRQTSIHVVLKIANKYSTESEAFRPKVSCIRQHRPVWTWHLTSTKVIFFLLQNFGM